MAIEEVDSKKKSKAVENLELSYHDKRKLQELDRN